MKVLIVEDDVLTVEWVSLFFSSNNMEVETATTVREAVGKISQFRPDVVISDVGLPGADGFELVQKLRSLEATAMVPVIAVSGYNLSEKEQQNFSAYLRKPVEPEQLLDVVRGLFDRKPQAD